MIYTKKWISRIIATSILCVYGLLFNACDSFAPIEVPEEVEKIEAAEQLQGIQGTDIADVKAIEEAKGVVRPSNYFPTELGIEWTYQDVSSDFFAHGPDYRVQFSVIGDTTFNGIQYNVISDPHYTQRFIRKSRTQYIEYQSYYFYGQKDENDKERVILDSSKEIGESWEYVNEFQKTIFTITNKIPRKVIDGVLFQGVIEVETSFLYFDQDSQLFVKDDYLSLTNTYVNHVGPTHLEQHMMSCGIFTMKFDLVRD